MGLKQVVHVSEVIFLISSHNYEHLIPLREVTVLLLDLSLQSMQNLIVLFSISGICIYINLAFVDSCIVIYLSTDKL